MEKNILASIILFSPDLERLKENIDAIKGQVNHLLLIANGPTCSKAIQLYASEHYITILENRENEGIAFALNQAMGFAKENGYTWVLTLDQDSVCPEQMVMVLVRHIVKDNIGIVCPGVIDRNLEEDKIEQEWKYVEKCITSGCLTSVEAWENVGGFTDKLFIDYVDFDYCAKLKKRGYKIIMDTSVKLLHEVGHITQIKFKNLSYILYNHSAFRTYYYFRNVIYYYKTHQDFVDVYEEKRALIIR